MSSQIGQGLFDLVGENFREEYWLFREIIIFDLQCSFQGRSQQRSALARVVNLKTSKLS
jgi:hypothetical protein